MSEITSSPRPSLTTLTQRLSATAPQGDRDLVLTACQQLIEHARATGQIPSPTTVIDLLELLRRYRRFEALSVLAGALIRMGRDELIVWRLYAQGPIDQGLLIPGWEVLRGLVRCAAGDPIEYSEVRGLMGRVNKQIYVDARGRSSDQARQALRQAIACYQEVYDEDRQKHRLDRSGERPAKAHGGRMGLR